MKKIFKVIVWSVFCMSFFACLTACEPKAKQVTLNTNEEIITQRVSTTEKIPITVLVKYAFSINTFEAAAEEKFPNIDLIQVGNYTSDMGIDEYYARLKNDDLTDIVMMWPYDVGSEFWEDRLLELSAFPFTNNYHTSMLNELSRDGKLYYLPGPSQIRSIIYNKTLFAEKGWKVPTDFESFISLCHEIEQSGIRSLQLGLGNEEVIDTAFVGFSPDSFISPAGAGKLRDYNNGNGSFGDNFTGALNTFQRLIDEKIFKKSDLDVRYDDRERMLFSRECAMVEDSVILTRMGADANGCTDEFALMPFFSASGEDWARLYSVCHIGINKHLAEEKNKEKYDAVIELMNYTSTVEGQEALMGDTGAMFSSVVSAPAPQIPEIQYLLPALKHGRYGTFPTLKNSQQALRQGLSGMLTGEYKAEDVIKMVDKQNVRPPVPMTLLSSGKATENFSLTDTGNYITDVMRKQSGCEIALFMDNGKDGEYNGKGVSGKFYKGPLNSDDIKRVLPDLKHEENGELWTIEMSGENLINTLEYSIPVDNKIGWFYYFSGLKMEYSPTAEQGTRIGKITTDTGEKIDPEKLYTIAVMDYTVPEEYVESCEKTGVAISDILTDEIRESKEISPAKDNRFIVK